MMLFGQRAMVPRARRSLEAATEAAGSGGATERERAHLAALAAWVSGDFAGATARWEALAAQYLRDLLALKLAQYGFFYAGESERMRDAGIDEKQAEAITGVLRDVHDADLSRLATKDDLAALRAELRAEMATLHTELKSEIELLRRDLTIRLGGMIVVPGGFLTAIKFLG